MQQNENIKLQSMYDDNQAILRVIAKKNGMPESEIEDAIQETFIAYYQKYSLEWTDDDKRYMLVRILKNKCMDYHRKMKLRYLTGLDGRIDIDEAELLTHCVDQDILVDIIADETHREVRECILSMKPKWRDAAILYFIEDRSINEISEMLGLSGAACRSRIAKARNYLQKALKTLNHA